MRRRISHRAYPHKLQGVPVTRKQLDALHVRLASLLKPPQGAQRPLADLLAEAWMMGVLEAGQHLSGLGVFPLKEAGDGRRCAD